MTRRPRCFVLNVACIFQERHFNSRAERCIQHQGSAFVVGHNSLSFASTANDTLPHDTVGTSAVAETHLVCGFVVPDHETSRSNYGVRRLGTWRILNYSHLRSYIQSDHGAVQS